MKYEYSQIVVYGPPGATGDCRIAPHGEVILMRRNTHRYYVLRGLVPRHVPVDPTENGISVVNETAIGHWLQCRLAFETQVAASHERTR